MTVAELEQRVAALEREVTELKEALKRQAKGNSWRATVGMFDKDETFAEIIAEGRRYREQERQADSE